MIVTERISDCSCGEKPAVRGGQDPNTLQWRFYVACLHCGNCERGSHETVEQAVAAWNRCGDE